MVMAIYPARPTSNDTPAIRPNSPSLPTHNETCTRLKVKQTPPCKLPTRLEESSGADITQVAVTSCSDDPAQTSCREVGVECGKAYEMLMPYATSEEKMDCVARALESGCTTNGKGGCAVKSKVVWQTLGNMCG
ncbi:hypothetical protein B0T26DRAFT_694977 [Lasiosphaeria miniovina]|uniref:Uncharacterized protein n=1 Tax=Lasiosphaeria miniovina TaxID=1954250 RepID=A0AA40B4J8_9PEZI|nr:uncharacterized protein B0T26DRAFT_694977 [Lasiosphaeria miniovina]KAK0727561.1 hypothetical protein B0T26DRAFT_694977 [Lasiosphaeria miniovina]